jgi:hypothetical protein
MPELTATYCPLFNKTDMIPPGRMMMVEECAIEQPLTVVALPTSNTLASYSLTSNKGQNDRKKKLQTQIRYGQTVLNSMVMTK